MKKILLLIVFSSFLNFSCKTTDSLKSNNDTVIITLDKKSGRGISPAYSLEIYEKGKMILIGIKNFDKIGKYQNKMTKKELKDLKKEFDKIDFFNLKDEYTSKITDLPTTYISYYKNGKTKKIRDYYGAPNELKNLEKKIEKYVEDNEWVKIK